MFRVVQNLVIVLLCLTCFASCSKNEESSAKAETKRQLLRSLEDTARNLAVINSRHDAQYYLDRMGEIITVCARGEEVDSECMRSGLERLRSE
jgi:hypothetical protein